MKKLTKLSQYVKSMRKRYNLTQEDLSMKSGVGLRFVRDLEQGKKTLRMDKVNQVLGLFNSAVRCIQSISKGEEVLEIIKKLFLLILPTYLAKSFWKMV